ncbi:MAG: HDOD domain-containing protein [Deltaproteobacteria bacterium]|nr:HDOD domain-containing protein [Deltaproteobacteria bacterium]
MTTEKDVDRIVKKIDQIPTLPIISQQIQELFHQEEVSIKQLREIIEQDPPLAIKILKIVNSAFYGLLNNVSSLDHALVILGFEEVKNIVLGFSIQNYFKNTNTSIDRKRFWEHSIICSQVAKYLGRHFNIVDDGTFFLSGLIHDMGKMVFDHYFQEEFGSIIEYISRNNSTFSKAEKEVLGVTHYQVSAKLLQQWHFPRKVIMQTFYHHAPWHDKNHTSGSIIIYLADMLTKMNGNTCLDEEKQVTIDDALSPSVLEFINKNGFDLDRNAFELMQTHIREFIESERQNVLNIFG